MNLPGLRIPFESKPKDLRGYLSKTKVRALFGQPMPPESA